MCAISQLSGLFPERSAIKQVSQTLRRACGVQKAFSMPPSPSSVVCATNALVPPAYRALSQDGFLNLRTVQQVCFVKGGGALGAGLLCTTHHHSGGGGGPTPPPVKDWAKFFFRPLANPNVSLVPSAPVSSDPNFSAAPLRP